MKYTSIIGLEVHAQLQTESKIFCGCSAQYGMPPNTNTCPVCLGFPGALPVLNEKAVALAVKTAFALNCSVNERSVFARKNYFYPDLPKGYQISQYDKPLAEGGFVDIEIDGKQKRIGIKRVHLEEDAGKSIHDGMHDSDMKTYIDFNRSGVPLVEIVTEPDVRSPEEAYAYLMRIKSILLYIGVCNCNMEEGSLRCDVNVSVMREGANQFGTKVEVKNLNSYRNVQKALGFEISRQKEMLDQKRAIDHETRLYNDATGKTEQMRTKEEAHDYRYFPEPDLLPLVLDRDWVQKIRNEIPELPDKKKKRFIEQYGIPEYDADILIAELPLADYFESVARISGNGKASSNWIMGDILRELKNDKQSIDACPLPPEKLAAMIMMIDSGEISGKMAKEVFEEIYRSGKDPGEIVKEKGFKQITDREEIVRVAEEVMKENPRPLAQYRKGKKATFGFFVGQVMKKTDGRANPDLVNEILREKLDKEE